ncbi:HAD subfamily IIID h [Auriculariales sp. MPI-PUGE-AT-0066]|nr:HAD subfamily IIID h [Auriculariales sp. MPI-PUGE-AT-0066]
MIVGAGVEACSKSRDIPNASFEPPCRRLESVRPPMSTPEATCSHTVRTELIATSMTTDVALQSSTDVAPTSAERGASLPPALDTGSNGDADVQPVIEKLLEFKFSWMGKTLEFKIAESDCVIDLKATIQNLTKVPIERQKILGLSGLSKGRLPFDGSKLADLAVGKKLTLIGTPSGEELVDPDDLDDLPEVINDLEPDLDPAAARALAHDQRNVRKVKEMTKKLQLNIMNPPRPGKKLLVLDIDYTIVDTKPLTTGALPAAQCARPGLHEFLAAAYEHFDIAIWSQTSWSWLEVKLVELGMVGGDKPYRISFVLDKSIMFQVYSIRDGKEYKHAVKPLKIIWNLLPQYNAANTIHIDDLSRNFALNPGNGIKITAFKDCTTSRSRQDEELRFCSVYLRFLADVPDISSCDHSKWRTLATTLSRIVPRRL